MHACACNVDKRPSARVVVKRPECPRLPGVLSRARGAPVRPRGFCRVEGDQRGVVVGGDEPDVRRALLRDLEVGGVRHGLARG